MLSKVDQNEIGVAAPGTQPDLRKLRKDKSFSLLDLGRIVPYDLFVIEYVFPNLHGKIADVINRLEFFDMRDDLRRSRGITKAHAGNTAGFRKGSRDDHVWEFGTPGQHGFSVKIVIGLIDEHDSVVRRRR